MKFDVYRSWNWKGKAPNKTENQLYLSYSEEDEHETEDQEENVEVANEGGAHRPTRNTQPLSRLNDCEAP